MVATSTNWLTVLVTAIGTLAVAAGAYAGLRVLRPLKHQRPIAQFGDAFVHSYMDEGYAYLRVPVRIVPGADGRWVVKGFKTKIKIDGHKVPATPHVEYPSVGDQVLRDAIDYRIPPPKERAHVAVRMRFVNGGGARIRQNARLHED